MNQKLDEMIRKVQEFCETREWDQFHSPKELAIGLVTESSELLEIFRFLSDEQVLQVFSNPQKKKAVEDELADVLFFILRFAQMNEISLQECLTNKLQQNAEKYPISKAKGNNQKYNEYGAD